jgi:hypothetical protein
MRAARSLPRGCSDAPPPCHPGANTTAATNKKTNRERINQPSDEGPRYFIRRHHVAPTPSAITPILPTHITGMIGEEWSPHLVITTRTYPRCGAWCTDRRSSDREADRRLAFRADKGCDVIPTPDAFDSARRSSHRAPLRSGARMSAACAIPSPAPEDPRLDSERSTCERLVVTPPADMRLR